MAYPPYSPKLVPLSSANSPRTLGMLLHLQLSPIWEQEALAVQQGERHRQQNPEHKTRNNTITTACDSSDYVHESKKN